MTLTAEQQHKVDQIANEVYKYFGVVEQDIINHNMKEKPSTARYFLYYILHYNLGLSSSTIANMYFRAPRCVKRGVAKIKLGVVRHKYYNAIYTDLMEKIQPLIPGDIDTFLNKS